MMMLQPQEIEKCQEIMYTNGRVEDEYCQSRAQSFVIQHSGFSLSYSCFVQ